jgi:hypothetical protein
MDYMLLRQIIINQNIFFKNKNVGYIRDKLELIKKDVSNPTIIVITGHRRVGKSTLFLQIANFFYKNNYYYLDFSDPILRKINVEDFLKIEEIFLKEFKKRDAFFFDEIQGVPDWNLFVNQLRDKGYKVFITGSNADLLSKEISTYLTGRHKDYELFPFSFKEYLGYNNITKGDFTTSENALILSYFDKYLNNGGFPEIVIYDQKELLKSIYNDIILKDVALRWDLKNISELEDLSFYLLSNSTQEYNYNSLKKQVNIKDAKTVKQYINYLCKTYMFFEVTQFDFSLNKQRKRNKKIYVLDNGFLTQVGYSFAIGKSRYLENLIFIELKIRGFEVYFYKDNLNQECDFLTVKNKKVYEAFQVCFSLDSKETENREIKGLLSALKKYNLKEGKIITYNTEKEIKVDDFLINFIPAFKWLLD